jgi:hypothetical protein
VGKAADKKDADLKKAERREAEARALLHRAGGLTGKPMLAIDRYFAQYASKPRPDLFLDVIARIDELGLMLLPEHRDGISGALASVFSLHPERQDAWRLALAQKPSLGKILDTAERLTPPMNDAAISRPGCIDYLWMSWIITRDLAALKRVLSLAHRHDPVGDAAHALILMHAELPEVSGALVETLQRRQASALPYRSAAPPEVPVDDVTALRLMLTMDPAQMKKILLVGWVTGDAGGFLVVTTDGSKPRGCPETWRQRPVKVRKAKPEELKVHQGMLDAAEDP